MIKKFLNVLAFRPIYPVYQMCTLYIHLYNTINPSISAESYCQEYHFDMVFHCTEYTQIHWLELTGVAISLLALILHFDMSHKILLFICSHLWNHLYIIFISSHTMITQLKTFHSKVFHNCYWYADYMHCTWINDALVTGQEIWLAYENYIWLTSTSSLHTYPILIN